MSNATLKSIAHTTGYSITTVSRALAGYDDVSEQTRQIILQEAQRQGYQPNLNARLLQKQRTQTIGLIIPVTGPRLPNPFFSEFVAGVSMQASQSGYDLLLSTETDVTFEMDHYRRIVSRGRVDGLILVRARHNDPRIAYLLETGIPFVVFGRTDSSSGYSYIDMDGIAGQKALTEHFIELGHTRIAYIAAPESLMFTAYRIQGFREAMIQHNLAVDPQLVLHGDLTERSGREIAYHLLDLPNPPTAIMTGNDLMAFGVMNAVQQRGLRIGVDVAVGGFDDIPSAEFTQMGLTTVHQPVYDIGQHLTIMLLQIIAGKITEPQQILLKPEVVIRGSSRITQIE